MQTYQTINPGKAYKILNPGGLVLICTKSSTNQYNIAPIAWHCPVDYNGTTRLLFVCDHEHKTFKNIFETKQFAIALPHINQLNMVKNAGKLSGHKVNKYESLKIQSHRAETVDCLLPDGCIAYLECEAYNIVADGGVNIVFGSVNTAKAIATAFSDRLLCELDGAKIIHHLGGKIFTTPANELY